VHLDISVCENQQDALLLSIYFDNQPLRVSSTLTAHHQEVRVNQFHDRPWQALRVLGGWGSQILRQSAHEGNKDVSPTHRPPLPPGNIPGIHFCRGWVDPRAIVRPEGLCQWKISVTPLGIDPATFRFVAQCLNHCTTACIIRRYSAIETWWHKPARERGV
jgi:hypothetical protein